MAWYLKFPADTGNPNNNNKLIQLSGIATTGTVNVAITYAENAVDPTTAGKGAYLFDGRRSLDSNTNKGDAFGYFLEYANAIETSGISNYKLNGVTSNSGAWRTALAGQTYSFDIVATGNGVIALGARFNQVEHFPLFTVKTIVITDAGGTHTIDMSASGGTLNQFTSTDGAVTLKLFGFTDLAHWIQYGASAQKNPWRNFPSSSIRPSDFIPWNNSSVIVEGFWEAEPFVGVAASIAFSMPQMTIAATASDTEPSGVASSVAFNMPQMSVAIAASKTVPAFAAASAFTMPQFTVAASASKTAPTFSASVTMAMPQFAVAAVSNVSQPGYSASIVFAMPQMQVASVASSSIPAVSANASFAMPQFSVAVSASKTAPTFAAASAFAMPQFGVAATLNNATPVVSGSISFTMPQMAVNANAESFVSGINTAINFAMPQLMVAVSFEGAAYYTAEGALITQYSGTRIITQSKQSSHIEAGSQSTLINKIEKSRFIAYNYQSTHIEQRI